MHYALDTFNEITDIGVRYHTPMFAGTQSHGKFDRAFTKNSSGFYDRFDDAFNGIAVDNNNNIKADFNGGRQIAFCGSTGVTELYLGLDHEFRKVFFNVTSASSGGEAAFEYWNGNAWAGLSVPSAVDYTRNPAVGSFTKTGYNAAVHPPQNWGRNRVTGNLSLEIPKFFT